MDPGGGYEELFGGWKWRFHAFGVKQAFMAFALWIDLAAIIGRFRFFYNIVLISLLLQFSKLLRGYSIRSLFFNSYIPLYSHLGVRHTGPPCLD